MEAGGGVVAGGDGNRSMALTSTCTEKKKKGSEGVRWAGLDRLSGKREGKRGREKLG